MGHGRLRWVLVAGTVIVASLGLPATPASAAPITMPAFDTPAAGPVSGDVNVVVDSSALAVQFAIGGALYDQFDVIAGKATAPWPTWSLPNGAYTWTAVDCDAFDCNLTQPVPSRTFTVTNTPPAISAPAAGTTVSGDVTVTATTAAPKVQFYGDDVSHAIGAPVVTTGGSASATWSTFAVPDGTHTILAAACDDNGCNPATSSRTVTTVNAGPAITPVNGATVSGVVNISATTLASQVQFSLDGNAVGGPVAVTGGVASTTWTTWGLENKSYAWTAAAVCDNAACVRPQSTVNLTLDNAAPAITYPANGNVTSPAVTIDATAPGGGLAFIVDGAQVGFDATAPYSFEPSTPLSLGGHTVSAKSCDVTGVTCSGPSSPTVTFSVGQLKPSIASVTPNPFSPGTHNGKDRTAFRVHLPSEQRLTYLVRNSHGQTVDGPHSAGLVRGGNHTYSWDGRNNSGDVVGDGSFTIVVNTAKGSGATLVEGADSATVRVDHTPVSFAGVTGKQSTAYPVVDGYLDAFRPSVRVSEGARLRMVISASHGKRLRTIAQSHTSKGTFRFTWNGRDAKKRLVPAGTYSYRFLAVDQAGNPSASRRFVMHVSHRRTVRKAIKILRPGDVGRVGATNARCTQYSYGFSNFTHGLWLDNFCDQGFDDDVIYADYTLRAPGAITYESIQVRTDGATYAPGSLSVLIYNFTDSEWEAAGQQALRGKKRIVTTFRKVSGAHKVSLRHLVRIRVAVPNFKRQADYDIARAGVVITYRVLR